MGKSDDDLGAGDQVILICREAVLLLLDSTGVCLVALEKSDLMYYNYSG